LVSNLAKGKALPEVLLEQIVAKTDGVPLFVEELTKSILESGELKDAGDHYAYVGPARTITTPATLKDALMARLDRYMPVREIAQIGAAIGRQFSYELISAVAPLAKAELDVALAQLKDSGLAFQRGAIPPRCTPSLRRADMAYESLLKTRRWIASQDRPCARRALSEQGHRTELLAHHIQKLG
jgi:hypothetical protein